MFGGGIRQVRLRFSHSLITHLFNTRLGTNESSHIHLNGKIWRMYTRFLVWIRGRCSRLLLDQSLPALIRNTSPGEPSSSGTDQTGSQDHPSSRNEPRLHRSFTHRYASGLFSLVPRKHLARFSCIDFPPSPSPLFWLFYTSPFPNTFTGIDLGGLCARAEKLDIRLGGARIIVHIQIDPKAVEDLISLVSQMKTETSLNGTSSVGPSRLLGTAYDAH